MKIDYARLLRFSRQFGKYYEGRLTPLLEESGLSMREIQVLLFLANNPSYDTARDVTLLRGLSKSQVSEAVELLAGRGFLQRTPDSADRRIIRLTVTERAMPLAREAQAVQSGCGRELLAGLTAEEERQLRTILEKVLANGERLAGKEFLE